MNSASMNSASMNSASAATAGLSSSPLQAAVLGHPIGHSRSPSLHAAAYAYLGQRIEYARHDVDEDGLAGFLAGAGSSSTPWVGWSVTMPLKCALVSHMDRISERVRLLGVLNTVVHEGGRPGQPRQPGEPVSGLMGENTDVDGIVHALGEADARGILQPGAAPPQGLRFGILGAGATATAALAAASDLGFGRVVIYARSAERAAETLPVAQALGLTVDIRSVADLSTDLSAGEATGIAALVSTLPPRAADSVAGQLRGLPEGLPLLDVAYDPWPSELALAWEAMGGAVVSGLAMLLHQAVKQVELFTAGTNHAATSLPPVEHLAMVESMRHAVGLA